MELTLGELIIEFQKKHSLQESELEAILGITRGQIYNYKKERFKGTPARVKEYVQLMSNYESELSDRNFLSEPSVKYDKPISQINESLIDTINSQQRTIERIVNTLADENQKLLNILAHQDKSNNPIGDAAQAIIATHRSKSS